MRRSGRLRFDLSPLAHPAWWVALLVLAVNDHLLKGSGIVPGWLTGKLSDFAFLIVAPVLAAVAFPLAVPRRRAIALVVVGGLFAAAKLSRAVSDELVVVVRHAGIVWRLWPDPTDLVALVMLPIAARVLRAPSGRLARLLPQRAGVLLGALACAATSAPLNYPHSPFLFNAAPAEATITVTWLLRNVPCLAQGVGQPPDAGSWIPVDLATLAASLTPGDLGDPIQLDLQRGQTAALDGAPPANVSPAGVCTVNQGNALGAVCVAAILDSPPATPVLMVARPWWGESDDGSGCSSGPPPVSACQPMMDPSKSAGPDAVTLREIDGALTFVAGKEVRLAPIDPTAVMARTSPPGNCRDLRAQYEAMLQPQPCSTDADCTAVPNLPIPGASAPCGVDTTLAGAQALARFATQWSAGCFSGAGTACYLPQPAVCRAGTCAAVCPGASLPACSAYCYGSDGIDGAACVQGEAPCIGEVTGSVCSCVNGQIACQSAQALSATCPLPCVQSPGGGTYHPAFVPQPSSDASLDARD